MSYYDAEGHIRSDLLDTEALKMAKSFVTHDNNKPNKLGKGSLTSAQMRRFFSEFRDLEKKVTAKGFDPVKPLIKMVKSKAAYAANPGNRKIPEKFKDFLTDNVDAIQSKKDFEAFMLHFEAVVGFFYGIPGVGK